jgi:hypothetical protein
MMRLTSVQGRIANFVFAGGVAALMAFAPLARAQNAPAAAPSTLPSPAPTTPPIPGAAPAPNSVCAGKSAKECVALALDALGGRERLQAIHNIRLETISHTELMEQSYRQAPFITAYGRGTSIMDFAKQRYRATSKLTWPEADPGQAESESLVIVGPAGGVVSVQGQTFPAPLSVLDPVREAMALGPARVLLVAADAADLAYDRPEKLRETPHTVVRFTWGKVPVRVSINPFNALPDAVETIQQFDDFWFFWGDVRQRVYFDNFERFHGVSYPTNLIEERNGALWRSTQALNVEFNVTLDDKDFAMDEKMAAASAGGSGWKRKFSAGKPTALAPGVDLYTGAWNATIIKQDDGVAILEAPISESYMQGVLDEAAKQYPGVPIRAVFSTSDSWPHTGGVRLARARKLGVYILDLNQPLLDRLMEAPHTIDPDALQRSLVALDADRVNKATAWRTVSGKTVVGTGDNRVELYPIRGAGTERQYMVYFPQHKLLYASDTLALNEDGSLYDPELMHEVAAAVARENLDVTTVFAMHQGPIPWSQVTTLLAKAEK